MSYCGGDCPCLEGTPEGNERMAFILSGSCSLPTAGEIYDGVERGQFWECHSHKGKICQGAISHAKKIGKLIPDYPTAGEYWGDLTESLEE